MSSRYGTKGLIALVLASALAASMATVTLALPFSDTGNSPFVDEIDEITDAGCASGFPDGTFKPQDNVRRQQFAYWLSNCGGRVFSNRSTNTLTYSGSGQQVAASRTVTIPGASGSGQTQYLHLDGIADVGTDELNFDSFCVSIASCSVSVQLYHGGTQVGEQTVTWNNWDGDVNPNRLTVPVQAVIPVETGSTLTYSMRVQATGLEASAGKIYDRSLTATLFPFN